MWAWRRVRIGSSLLAVVIIFQLRFPCMETGNCPFCDLPQTRKWLESEYAIAFMDGYPITEGHSLVIPRKHVASVFDLSQHEQTALWAMVADARSKLMELHSVEAFNIGINDGIRAGQTIPHAHIHVIPRREGDVQDPRGGVRWVVPDKADYWTLR
jgi:diadenosine tetraphosphate (Ap4A) HIT family hydrolase